MAATVAASSTPALAACSPSSRRTGDARLRAQAVRSGVEVVGATGPHLYAQAMKFGIVYSTGQQGVDPARLTKVVQHAEALGFESVYTTEHISLTVGESVGGM